MGNMADRPPERVKMGKPKLDRELVAAIREQAREGKSAPEIQREVRVVSGLKIGAETLRRVIRGETWQEVLVAGTPEDVAREAKESLEKLLGLLGKEKEKVAQVHMMAGELKGGPIDE